MKNQDYFEAYNKLASIGELSGKKLVYAVGINKKKLLAECQNIEAVKAEESKEFKKWKKDKKIV